MENPVNLPQCCTSIFRNELPRTSFALTLLGALAIVAPPAAQAQTFNVIHNFSGGQDVLPKQKRIG